MEDMREIFYAPEAKPVELAEPGTDGYITFLEWKFDELSQGLPTEERSAVFAKFRHARGALLKAQREVQRDVASARELALAAGVEF